MCSTNEPYSRGSTSPTRNAGSTVSAAESIWSTLQAGAGDAFDDMALEQQEHGDERDRAEDRGRHRVRVPNAERTLHRGEADRNRHDVGVAQHEQRPQQVVPRLDESEDRDGS